MNIGVYMRYRADMIGPSSLTGLITYYDGRSGYSGLILPPNTFYGYSYISLPHPSYLMIYPP